MEMSKGVSLLRTAQSLLAGRTLGSGHIFEVQILNFNIFGRFQKVEYFLGTHIKILGDITKLDYI